MNFHSSRLDRIETQSRDLTRQLQEGIILLDSMHQHHNQHQQQKQVQIPMATLLHLAQQEQEQLLNMRKRLTPRPHVARLVLLEAELDREVCPISMEPLKVETSCCVGPCYHVFHKSAIQTWLRTSNLCPVCREECCL